MSYALSGEKMSYMPSPCQYRPSDFAWRKRCFHFMIGPGCAAVERYLQEAFVFAMTLIKKCTCIHKAQP
jgi:hypothetical protein